MKNIIAVLMITMVIQGCQTSNSELVTVESVLANPEQYLNQEIIVTGFVGQVTNGKQQFSLLGEKEFNACGIGECNANELLPVDYKGVMPDLSNKIEVIGQIIRSKAGFIYEASSIRNIEDLSRE